MNQQLQIINHSNQRVLTTAQLAEAYGTETKLISKNFERNESRYKEGKHYYALAGEELKQFKADRQIDGNLKFAPVIYLWTEKGAWLHAKSLNTDEAWNAYEQLVDDYYQVKTEQQYKLSPELQAIFALDQRSQEFDNRLSQVETKVDNQITLDHGQQRVLQKAVGAKIYSIEPDPTLRGDLFQQLYREIKNRWEVSSYRDVKKTELNEVLDYVSAWKPVKKGA